MDLPDIPYLPTPSSEMSWRDLNAFREGDRGAAFYLTCLEYGQHLWRKSLPARAILCLDRAWGADLDGSEPELAEWPLPYRALIAIMKNTPDGIFLGNPRVHFQHYADRLGEPRIEQRKWRSWACWALTRAAMPRFPGDPRHDVEEPTLEEISNNLIRFGHDGEEALWKRVLEENA